jgi:hypothetical protein
VDVAVDEVDDDEEVLELPHALRAAAATTSTTRSAERRRIMPPSSRNRRGLVERPAGPLRSHSGLRYARARSGSVLVVDVDDLGGLDISRPITLVMSISPANRQVLNGWLWKPRRIDHPRIASSATIYRRRRPPATRCSDHVSIFRS